MKKIIYFLPVILFILLGVFLFRGISLDPSEMPSALIDKPVPVFSLPSLDGSKLYSKHNLDGEVTLLNVWATWCVSCRMEHPYLLKLSGQGVHIVGLDYKDDKVKAQAWLQELGNPYALTIADKTGTLGLDLGVFGAPETFLLDRQGFIRYKRVGVIDETVWAKDIKPVYEKLLRQ
jgi:cytochrome c biogenesis protein CcmG, thiol:disulfide interchange protein DsbE